MPVRIKITLLFTGMVFFILLLICSAVYYFSYSSRLDNIKTRLVNRAITTASLLGQSETSDPGLMQKINAATALSMKNKTVQAYNYKNENVYTYTDAPGDSIAVSADILDDARVNTMKYFISGKREAIAYHYIDKNTRNVIVAAAYDEEGKYNLQQLKLILISSFLGGIIITIVTGYFFSRQLLLPVKNIADELNNISARNLKHRLPSGNAKDEWSYLSLTLNELLNRLQESFEVQQRFISNASHELSTPLTSISSQLEVSLQRERDAADYKKVISSVLQDVHHLSSLTHSLLEFAMASGNFGGIELDLVRIDEVLMRIPGEISKENNAFSVKLDFLQMPEDEKMLLVFGNAELLFMAIKNIVSNACKYSDDHIALLQLSVKGKMISIEIIDKGRGIPEKELENIFLPFYRSGYTRSITGFGLGLPLASRFIKLHKGNIEARSIEKKGSAFIINLPVAG